MKYLEAQIISNTAHCKLVLENKQQLFSVPAKILSNGMAGENCQAKLTIEGFLVCFNDISEKALSFLLNQIRNEL